MFIANNLDMTKENNNIDNFISSIISVIVKDNKKNMVVTFDKIINIIPLLLIGRYGKLKRGPTENISQI